MKTLPQHTSMPDGIVLEKPGRNLDSLVQNDAIRELKATLLHEWNISDAFEDVEQFGIRPTTLALFYGPPGNGKTMSAKMLASEMGAPLYRVSCEGLLSSYLGASERNMQTILQWLETAGPAVVLFDECEALFLKRGSTGGECTRAVVRTMQIFWQAVDRWEAPQLFLLATNRIEDIDDALLSRCETKLEFVGPTKEQASLVIDYWTEVLHEHGSEHWAPVLRKSVSKSPPVSFRALWQSISDATRHFIVNSHR